MFFRCIDIEISIYVMETTNDELQLMPFNGKCIQISLILPETVMEMQRVTNRLMSESWDETAVNEHHMVHCELWMLFCKHIVQV